ncbi:MAG: hypothetical protein WAT19_05855 [Ferruginibacter sp.]
MPAKIFENEIALIESTLSKVEHRMIFFVSIKNFILYIEEIPNVEDREETKKMLAQYFDFIVNEQIIDISLKKFIQKKYLIPLSQVYIKNFHFKYHTSLKTILFISIQIDVLLYIIGISKKWFFLPMATIAMAGYWLFVETFYAKKGKVYGV